MTSSLAYRHLSALTDLSRQPEAFHPRHALLGASLATMAHLLERGLIETAEGDGGEPARYRITAAGVKALAEAWEARHAHRERQREAARRHPFADLIAANVARLAAERGLSVAEVEERAGLRPGSLSPVRAAFTVRSPFAVADALGVEPADLVARP